MQTYSQQEIDNPIINDNLNTTLTSRARTLVTKEECERLALVLYMITLCDDMLPERSEIIIFLNSVNPSLFISKDYRAILIAIRSFSTNAYRSDTITPITLVQLSEYVKTYLTNESFKNITKEALKQISITSAIKEFESTTYLYKRLYKEFGLLDLETVKDVVDWVADYKAEDIVRTGAQELLETKGSKAAALSNLVDRISLFTSMLQQHKKGEDNPYILGNDTITETQTNPDKYKFTFSPINLKQEFDGIGIIPPKTYTIIGALPGSGKTATLVQNLICILMRYEEWDVKPMVLLYSVELDKHTIFKQIARAFCYMYFYSFYEEIKEHHDAFNFQYESIPNAHVLKPEELTERLVKQRDDLMWQCLYHFTTYLRDSGWEDRLVILDAEKCPTIESFSQYCVSLEIKNKVPDFVLIDYLQICETEDEHAQDRERNNKISATIRKLTKKYKWRAICAAQLRDKDYTLEEMPQAEDIKETRNYTQDADIVITLFKPAVKGVQKEQQQQQQQTPSPPTNLVYMLVAKNRKGSRTVKPHACYLHKGNGIFSIDLARNTPFIKSNFNFNQRLQHLRDLNARRSNLDSM